MKEMITMEDKESDLSSPLKRFEKSMQINYEKWHDGIGSDINAIKLASISACKAIEGLLVNHLPLDWRDIETLASLNKASARALMKK